MCLVMHCAFFLIVLQYVWETLVYSTNTGFVNRTQAEYNCRQYGGLYQVKSNQLIGHIANITLDTTHIQNGQSAWINGYAQLSTHFMSYYGCYSNTSYRSFTQQDFFTCAENCKTYDYIGIRQRQCYCISIKEDLVKLQPVADIHCKYRPYQSQWLSQDFYISLYSVSNDVQLSETDDNSLCLVGRLEYRTPKYSTKSCYTKTRDVQGYICTNSATGPMTIDQCSSSQACFIYNVTDWWTAREQCLKHNGKLLPYLLPDHTSTNYPSNYWLGRFRSFKIVDDVTTACLSVTRFESLSKLIVEPDNCSSRKMALCVNGLINIHEQAEPTTVSTEPAETSTPGESITTNIDNTDTTSNDEMPTSTCYMSCMPYTSHTIVNNYHALYVTISIAVFIITVLVLILIKMILMRKATMRTCACKNEAATAVMPAQHVPMARNPIEMDTLNKAGEYSQINNTLSCTNVTPGDQLKPPFQDDSYDKINLKGKKPTAPLANIYDTTSTTRRGTNNDYDKVQTLHQSRKHQHQNEEDVYDTVETKL